MQEERTNHSSINIDYLAGFIDADGSIGLYYNDAVSSLPLPVISITNTNRSIMIGIKATCDLWDVKAGLVVRAGIKRENKGQYRLAVTSQGSVRKLLTMLIPSLKIKQEQAEILLRYLKKRRVLCHRVDDDFRKFAQQSVDEIKELKQVCV